MSAVETTTGIVVDARYMEHEIAELLEGHTEPFNHGHLYCVIACWFNDYMEVGDTWELLDELIQNLLGYEPQSGLYSYSYEMIEALHKLLTPNLNRLIPPLLQNTDIDILDMELKDYRNGVFFIHSTRLRCT